MFGHTLPHAGGLFTRLRIAQSYVEPLDYLITVACLGLSYLLHRLNTARPHVGVPPAYIVRSVTTHTRLLPVDAQHSFRYPVLSLLLPLSALEAGRLSLLCGFLFSYGSITWRVLGLRSAGYLYDDDGIEPSIRAKLVRALGDFGIKRVEERLDDAWVLTMPSYFGFEGINPLTVYFCYQKDEPGLWLSVLEVHNTFGERHLYILEVGTNEETPDIGFDHQWSFPRTFHVSPFNDRLGTYTVSLRAPSFTAPFPHVRVHLHTPTGAPKLTASLRGRSAAPLRTRTVLTALAKHPFILLSTLPRILRHAMALHYRRRLPVFRRPEPHPVRWVAAAYPVPAAKGGGVGWQRATLLERAARRVVYAHLNRRAPALGVCVELTAGDPSVPTVQFGVADAPRALRISHRSQNVYTLLVRGRADPGEFVISDEALFRDVFEEGWGGTARAALCSVLAVGGRVEELVWRVARVRWAELDMGRASSGPSRRYAPGAEC
ncbi:hypothetical protein BC834DRAFT_967286 [Gloeopeniophorella convolvens]|nr:hypothetical protein BC834DRAFT_967286 [Gloeopeniophorella convolvens]